jgi:hypothetical protein
MGKDYVKYCSVCKKNITPYSKKEMVGWGTGFHVKEHYCPDCDLKLTNNVTLGWIICCSLIIISAIIGFLTISPFGILNK